MLQVCLTGLCSFSFHPPLVDIALLSTQVKLKANNIRDVLARYRNIFSKIGIEWKYRKAYFKNNLKTSFFTLRKVIFQRYERWPQTQALLPQ